MKDRFIEFTPSENRTHAATADSYAVRTGSPIGLVDERHLRGLLFLATFMLTWFTVSPFPNLSNPALLTPTTAGSLLGQASMLLLTAALAGFAFVKRSVRVWSVATPALLLTFAAFAISALLSAYPDVALRRLLLAGMTIFQAAALLLLPYDRRHFARLLTVAAAIVLAACYFGVIFLPHLSIHQASDIAEPGLAGDWRGFFTHKNGAGAAMVVLIFIGIFIARTWSRFSGIAIIVLAAVFLEFTESRSPRNLLPLVLLLSYILPRIRSALPALAIIVIVPAAINLLTVGSVMFAPIRDWVYALLSDPTYDGRDEIWSFALDHVARRPWVGFGFESFWGMPDLVDKWSYLESWGYRASDAHNGCLNLAVTTGIAGLACALLWIVMQPFLNWRGALARGSDQALTTLFLQIWIFGLGLAGFESVFFAGGSGVWFMVAVSIIGLRFQSITQSVEPAEC